MVTDIVGEPLVGMTSFPTDRDPGRLVAKLAARIRDTLARHPELGRCEGVGVVVPGMVDRTGTRVLFAPRLGWRDVPFQEPLAAATGLPVVIENSGKACALAQAWSARGEPAAPGGLVFLSVSDGLGVGVVTNGQLLRGQHNAGGEFGHIPLALDGPALRLRRPGLLGGARLEPGHPLALPGPRARSRASPSRPRWPPSPSRTSSRARARATRRPWPRCAPPRTTSARGWPPSSTPSIPRAST